MEDMHSIMPHRGKMLFLTKVNAYNLQEESIEAEYHLTEDNLFFDAAMGGVPAWVGFELIAQTVSAYMGIKTRLRGEPVKIGFVLSVSQVQMGLSFFSAGSILIIKAQEFERVGSMYIYKGEIFTGGSKVLEGKVTVMEVDEGSDLIG